MAFKQPSLSISHRYGQDEANDSKGVVALVVIHALRSKVLVAVFLAALAGAGLVPFEDIYKQLPQIEVEPHEQ